MDALNILTVFVLIILTGLLITWFSNKLKISNVLLLILTGLFVGANQNLLGFEVDHLALVVLAVISLVLIIFDGSSRFDIKTLTEFSFKALNLIFWFILFNLFFLVIPVTYFIYGHFEWTTIMYASIFAIIMAATDPATIFVMMKNKANKVIEMLEVEAIFNTPITVLLPFVFLEMTNKLGSASLVGTYFEQFFTQVLVGIGSGVLVGLFFFKAMRNFYSDQISPLALVTAALLSYILAENLNGSGVLAVAVLGFMFGNMVMRHKDMLQEFSSMLSNSLEILVFLLLGLIIQLNISLKFIGISLLVFGILLLSRYLALQASLGNLFNFKEKLFMTLNMPKGIATAVLVFSLSILSIPDLMPMLNLVVIIMIYSLLLSTIMNRYSQNFIRVKIDG